MKSLTYNNPERAKERANVVPPSIEEMGIAIYCLNSFIGFASVFAEDESDKERTYNLFQRLLDDYENKLHFYNVNKGWQGEVNYEIVKP